MKNIFLGDLHLGVKKDDMYLQNAMRKFFIQMCAYAKKHNIRRLVQTGDWFDVRAGLSQETLQFQREFLTPLLEEHFDIIDVLVGNHDMHLKHVITPNSAYEVFHDNPVFNIIQEPTTIQLGSTSWDVIPWECNENEAQIREFIDKSDSEYNVGHWELDGFEFYSGVPSSGVDPEFLSKYKQVISGHYHTQSERGNIRYIGTPYTITLGDANDVRGFWIFDSESETFEFEANENTWHYKLYYHEEFDHAGITKYAGKVVQLIVEKSDAKLEHVLTYLEENCHEFSDKHLEKFEFESDEDIKPQNLVTVIENYVDTIELTDDEKNRVKALARGLYTDATVA